MIEEGDERRQDLVEIRRGHQFRHRHFGEEHYGLAIHEVGRRLDSEPAERGHGRGAHPVSRFGGKSSFLHDRREREPRRLRTGQARDEVQLGERLARSLPDPRLETRHALLVFCRHNGQPTAVHLRESSARADLLPKQAHDSGALGSSGCHRIMTNPYGHVRLVRAPTQLGEQVMVPFVETSQACRIRTPQIGDERAEHRTRVLA